MNSKSVIITQDDIANIVKQNIHDLMYVMYSGLSHRDIQGLVQRQLLLKQNYILVLKAFFFPPSAITRFPSDLVATHGDDIAKQMMNNINPQEELKSAYNKTLNALMKFGQNVSYKSFKQTLPLYGYARKLEILTDHFKLNKEDVLQVLYLIQQETLNALFSVENEQSKQPIEQSTAT